jgi:hypothetical protein
MSLTVTATKGIRIGTSCSRRMSGGMVLSQAPGVGTTVNYAVINDSGNWRTYTATIMAKKES